MLIDNHDIPEQPQNEPAGVKLPEPADPGTGQQTQRMTVYAEPITHLGRKWIRLNIDDDFPAAELKKRLPSRHWSATHQAWLIPWRENWLPFLRAKLGGTAEVTDTPPVHHRVRRSVVAPRPAGQRTRRPSAKSPALPPEYVQQLQQRDYSPATIRVYLSHFNLMLTHVGHRPPQELAPGDVQDYLRYLTEEKGVSGSYRSQAYSALKFYYEQVLIPPRSISKPEGGNELPYQDKLPQSTDQPSQASEEPPQFSDEPAQASEEPPQFSDEPSQTFDEPPQIEDDQPIDSN